MIQDSKEWHEHRAAHFNASEAGAVMGVNPWYPKTPADLFDIKTGAGEVKENAAMARGKRLEPIARDWAITALEMDFTPVVKVKGRYSASLDGESFDGHTILEIKCPFRADSKLFNLSGVEGMKKTAPHYYWQVVHQLYVSGAKCCFFVVWSDTEQNVIAIHRDAIAGDFDSLLAAWEDFGRHLDEGKRPGQHESQELETLVSEYIAFKQVADQATAQLKAVEDQIKNYAKTSGLDSLTCNGIAIKKIERKGAVDYAKIPELHEVDLEQYRKKPTTYWSIK